MRAFGRLTIGDFVTGTIGSIAVRRGPGARYSTVSWVAPDGRAVATAWAVGDLEWHEISQVEQWPDGRPID